MVEYLDSHPLFRRMSDEELVNDICCGCAMQDTEEGIKVQRNKGDKFLAVFERIPEDSSRIWHGFQPIKGEGNDLEVDIYDE